MSDPFANHRRSHHTVWIALGFSALGCHNSSQTEGRKSSAVQAVSSSLSAASETARGTPPQSSAVASASVTLATNPPAGEAAVRLKKYWAAMGRGRAASVKKSFDVALAAFSQALEALPDDARAYAERGYAQLLAKNYRLAREDFDRAAVRSDNPKLLAQIWYNYGLTAEQEGQADDARSAFARSNELNPTAQASGKLEGVSACTARVTERKTSPSDQPTVGDFLAAFAQLAEGRTPAQSATTDEEARAILCGKAGCSTTPNQGSPIRLLINDIAVYGAVIAQPDHGLRIFPTLETVTGGPCGTANVVEVKHQSPFHFRLKVNRLIERFDGTEKNSCTETNSGPCIRHCVPSTAVVKDWVFSADGDEVRLLVEQWVSEGGKEPWAVSVSGTDARILGSGCDVTWELK